MLDPNATPAATATRAMLAALLRHAIGWAGLWFVHRGYLDQATADSATGPIADYVLGVGLALGAAGYSAAKARVSHWRWVQAWVAPARPLPAGTSSTTV